MGGTKSKRSKIGRRDGVASALLVLCAFALSGCAASGEKKIRSEVTPLYSARAPEFRQAMGSVLGPGFIPGNKIVTLVNGDQIFPAMLRAIRGARKSINFETYVYRDGVIGRELAMALAERARAGVKVHAILDAQGTFTMGASNLATLRDAGVEVSKYHSLLWLDPRRFNNRTHRKLLIIDGKTAFIGGAGIADLWTGHAEDPKHWRDNHYQVTGPVVAQMQAIFMENWLKTNGTLLHGNDYFPPLASTGSTPAQAFKSSPRNGEIAIEQMYLLAIASAQKSLLIENAYFLPNEMMRKALVHAAQRGVNVEVIVPGKHIDQKLVRYASRRHYPELVSGGVKLYEYEPTMVHVKLMIVDGIFASVGSANLDNRSIRLNDEANLDVLDSRFAAEQTRLFETDKRRSRPMTLDSKGKLLLGEPLNQAAGLVSPQL
jgi:cardiolipin synthase